METIYNSIRNELLKHSKVKHSVLGSVKEWKRSQYIILSEIIKTDLALSSELQNSKKFELGNTISHITLQRFFETEYQYKTHNDLRFLKTLDKLCIFLGFKDLNSYIQYQREKLEESFPTPIHNHLDNSFSKDIIYKYCSTVFEVYKSFPVLNLELVKDLVIENSPFLQRAKEFGTELCERKFELVTTNNRSNFEVFDINVITDEPDKKIIESQEFWNLLFKNGETGEEHFVNQFSTQVYFIRKVNNSWKIWDNYNPDAGKLNVKIIKP